MLVPIGAVVLIGVLCVVNLLLMLGVVRRLREHTAMIVAGHGAHTSAVGVPQGAVPMPFTVRTTTGNDLAGPAGLRLVGFFSASCSACPGRVPGFTGYVRRAGLARDAVLAVTVEGPAGSAAYLGQLAEVASVCQVSPDGEPIAAFQVAAFPAFFVLDGDGAVVAQGYEPDELPFLAVA
jgi:hypothetical protein